MDSVMSWLNAADQNGMVKASIIPTEADWSDEDGVRSGSATGISEAENDDVTKEKQKAIIMAKTLNGHTFDPVNVILDKIDAELSSLGRSQSSSTTGSTVLRKPGARSKSSDGSRSGGSHKSVSSKDGTDTGLGTASIHDNLSEGGDLPRINGTAEIYSDVGAVTTDHYSDDDGKKTGTPSDLDSVTAQQVDAKFKAILRKKKGGYLDNLKASDTETIRTEDFENRFKDALVYQSDSDTLENKSDVDSDKLTGELTDSGAETPTKADLSWDYYDTDQSKAGKILEEEEQVPARPRSPSGQNRPLSPSLRGHSHPIGQSGHMSGESNGYKPQTEDTLSKPRGEGRSSYHGTRSSPRRQAGYSRRKLGNVSDADSIRTEDFEVKFQELIYRPDSETDHTDNDPLHAKVKEILKVTAPYRQKKEKKQNGHVKEEDTSRKSAPKRGSKGNLELNQRTRSVSCWVNPQYSLDSRTFLPNTATSSSSLVKKQKYSDRESDGSSSLDLSADSDSKEVLCEDSQPLVLNPVHLESYSSRLHTSSTKHAPKLSSTKGSLGTYGTSLDSLSCSSRKHFFLDDSCLSSSLDSNSMTDGSSQQASEESQYAALHQGINRQFRSKTSLSSISTGYLGSLEETDTSSNSQLSGRSSSDFLGCFDLQPNLPSPLFDKLFQSVSVLDPSSFQGHEQEFLDSSSSNLDSKSDNMRNSETDSSKREVFLPEDEEEFPFSRYTFNKKPGKEVMCTSSGQSSSSLSSISSDSSLPQGRHSSLSSCQSYSSLFTGCSVIPDMNDPHNFPMNRHPPVPAHLPQGDITGSGLSYHSEELMSHGETASDMLFNLGFGGVDSFLPDRFARDWCQKIQKAHQERMDQHRLQLSYQQICPDQKTLVSGSTEPNINRESQANSSDKVCASGQQGPSQRTSTTLQKLHQLLQPSNLSSQGARDTRSWDGNHNIQAQEEIGAMDNNLIREKRRKQFLTNKQNALLAYLETLEEDEKMLHTRYRVLPSATQNRGNKLPTIDHSDTNSSNSGQQDSEEDTMEVFYNFQQNGLENSDPDHLTQSSIHQENLNSEINIGHGTISDRGCTQEQFGSHPDEDDVFNNDKDLACQLDRPRKQLEAPGILQDFPQTENSKTLKHKDEQNQYPNEVIPGKGHQRDRLEGQSSLGNVIVPSIQIGPTTQDTRTDSMEVAEILVQTLNNANDTAQKQSKMAKLLCVNTSDDRMLSPLSGSSSSPAVFSPVTVIEVNLDNQNDVMENEEGSKTFINQNGFSSTMSQDSDPGSYDRSDTGLRRKSFIDALVYDNCSDRVKKFDTRRLSLNLNCENAYGEHHNLNTMIHSIKQTETQDATLMKSNAVKSAANVKEKMCEQEKLGENQKSKDSNDVCIQADDGRLSPLVRQADLEKLLKCLEVHDGSESSYYLAQDRGTQWISSDLSEDSDLKEGTKGTGRSHGDVRHNPIRSADIQDKFPERGSRCNHHKSYSSKTDKRETLSPTYNPNLSINSDQKYRKPFYRDLHVSMDTDQKDRQPFARDLHVSMDTDQKDKQRFARDLHVSMDTDQKDRQPFARDLHVSMDTDQKKPNLQYNSDSALLNRKSGKIGENKRDKIGLGHASYCPSQVTIVTRGDHSYKSDSESSGSSESSYPLYNSQTMRRFFSSQKCDSIDIGTYNHGTQT